MRRMVLSLEPQILESGDLARGRAQAGFAAAARSTGVFSWGLAIAHGELVAAVESDMVRKKRD